MSPCEFCAEVGAGNKFQCPFCGRDIAHYLPTPEEIQHEAAEIRYHNEEARLRDPVTSTCYLPW